MFLDTLEPLLSWGRKGPGDLTIPLGVSLKRLRCEFLCPLGCPDLGTYRIIDDGIVVVSGVNPTTPRQSDGVRNGLF